ncbi:lipopolysaccharide biosynthesis protein [Kineosporia mesophila]|uniref:Lipopolysaccharide biosynthesis protein n=1 Tax=Kineosporia mesophila TaxID=566012 RepID=A0ABP6Z051_9ACTN|nr:lipopolysaccharide biosynthesis protein [Kineosporia mesophila]MCD5350984.1 lipopolysaccharide biosynthesis protein [Kineosporia mesophila]
MTSSVAPETAPETGLGGRVLSALRWSFVATVVIRFSSLGVSVAMARLLGPSEFGVYAVAFVVLAAVLSLNELGVSVALVRYQGDERVVVPTVATLSMLGSLVCYAVIFSVAPGVAASFGAPAAVGPIRLIGLCVIVDGLAAVPVALLQREFRQKRRAVADITNFGVGSVISIGLAVAGMGAVSLAAGRIVGSVASVVLLVSSVRGRWRFGWDRNQAGGLLAIGLPLAGSSLVVFGILSLDQFIVGHLGGATVLGIYVLAFNLSSWPVTALSQPVRAVTLPLFARLADDPARFSRTAVDCLGALLAVTVPVATGLGASAYPLVRVVYGPDWVSSSPVLVWLAVLGGCRVLLELFYDLLVALGATRQLFGLQVAWLVVLAVGLPVGQHLGGPVGVAVAHSLVCLFVIVPLNVRAMVMRTGTPVRALVLASLGPAAGGCVIVLTAVALQRSVPDLFALAGTGLVAGLFALRGVLRLRGRVAR